MSQRRPSFQHGSESSVHLPPSVRIITYSHYLQHFAVSSGGKKKVCIAMFEHMLLCRSTTTEVSSAATLSPPPLSSSPLPISSPSSLPVAPRNDLILIQTHFVQLPYMGEIAGMGPVDYALPPLCLFYLMPKTADNFKNLGQLIMRTISPPPSRFHLLPYVSIPFRMLFDTPKQHAEKNVSWHNKRVSEWCQRAFQYWWLAARN